MSETAYQFAVRILKSDPDVRAIVRCGECYGTGRVTAPSGFVTRKREGSIGQMLQWEEWVDGTEEPCGACGKTGVERVDRYSGQQDDPEFCYGETRLPIGRTSRRC